MKSPTIALLAATFLALAAPAQAQKSAGEIIDDSTVNASVKAKLVELKEVPSMQVNVETYRGVVLLSGFVETQAQKDAAGKAAKDVSGVRTVHNAIALHPATSMGAKLDDSMLTGKVKAALLDHKDVKSGQINVETKGGTVQLAGFVTGDGMRQRAIEVARSVDGVQRVEDALYVKPD